MSNSSRNSGQIFGHHFIYNSWMDNPIKVWMIWGLPPAILKLSNGDESKWKSQKGTWNVLGRGSTNEEKILYFV